MKRNLLHSDYFRKNFSSTTLTLSVDKMKSRGVVMVKPKIQTFSSGKVLIEEVMGDWWVVGKNYQPHYSTFQLTDIDNVAYYMIGFIVDNVTTTNRLYFNHIQLAEGEVTDYHQPVSNIPKTTVKFSNNFYANFYSTNEDSFLQVIRPYYNNMDTETITKSKVTVLAPHLANEDDIDSPSNIGLEFMNQTDQKIEILR